MNITKEGIEVKVGQIWQDLDKRKEHRKIQITRVENGRAYYGRTRLNSTSNSVAIRRMHKHANGFVLVLAND